MATVPASSPLSRIEPEAQLLTEREVGSLLRIAPRTVRVLAAEGRLTRVRLGRRSTRYRLDDVVALIDGCTNSETRPVTGFRTSSAGGDGRCGSG